MIIRGFTPFFGKLSIPNPYPISDTILLPFFSLVKTKIEKFYLLSSLFLAPCFEWKEGNLQKIKSKAYLVKNIDDYNKDGLFQGFGFTDDGESSAGECFAIP